MAFDEYCTSERCDIKRDSTCEMCVHSQMYGFVKCALGKRKGGTKRKCFECVDVEFCKKKASEYPK